MQGNQTPIEESTSTTARLTSAEKLNQQEIRRLAKHQAMGYLPRQDEVFYMSDPARADRPLRITKEMSQKITKGDIDMVKLKEAIEREEQRAAARAKLIAGTVGSGRRASRKK